MEERELVCRDQRTGTTVEAVRLDQVAACAHCPLDFASGDRVFEVVLTAPMLEMLQNPPRRLLFHNREEMVSFFLAAATHANTPTRQTELNAVASQLKSLMAKRAQP